MNCYVTCSSLEELIRVCAGLMRENIIFAADADLLRVTLKGY